MGYLAAIGTLISWTIATYVFAFATRKAEPASINRVRLFYASIALSIICCIIFGLNPITLFTQISWEQYLWFGISGFLGLTLGDYFAFSAFKILGNRRTSLFSCFAPSAAFLGASFILNEPLTIQGLGGMLVSVIGILILILSRSEKQGVTQEGHGNFTKGVVFGILGAVGQGIGLVFAKKGFEVSPNNFHPIYATWVRMLIASITVYMIGAFKVNLWKEFKDITFNKDIQKQVALGTFFGPMLGISLSLYAATHLEAGVAQTIFSMLPITVLLAAVIWFKEKINPISYLAVAISLAGVLILVLAISNWFNTLRGMNNSDIADILKAYADLSELHGGNPFKIKSFSAAAFKIDKYPIPLVGKSLEELESIQGIGKSIAKVIFDLITTQSFVELQDLIVQTPEGVRDIMRIKGIGPKKVATIWKEMGIESIGELLYACKENRLAQVKGFGLKTQDAIIKQIEFMFANANKFHYAKAYPCALAIVNALEALENTENVSLCGDIRRGFEVLEQIDILIETEDEDAVKNNLMAHQGIILQNQKWSYQGYAVQLHFCPLGSFAWELFRLSSDATHTEEILKRIGLPLPEITEEEEIYEAADLPFIPVVLRDNRGEISMAEANKLPTLIQYQDLKGPLHNHSTWSDGQNSIEEMAKFCIAQGFEFLGMADHSKSAFYANGLSEERVYQQQAEIAGLNQKLNGFKIFTGIECDILYDGSLDYPNEVLKSFDYIVASVHSVLKMTEEKAMERLLKAIENPYTTILGHLTGRLLLMREGYPINHHKIIDACAANKVVIELNANPYRLDIDWRYIDYALSKGVMISINPDAHETQGFLDMHWGVVAAQKGGLTKEMCFNAKSALELENYFKAKKG